MTGLSVDAAPPAAQGAPPGPAQPPPPKRGRPTNAERAAKAQAQQQPAPAATAPAADAPSKPVERCWVCGEPFAPHEPADWLEAPQAFKHKKCAVPAPTAAATEPAPPVSDRDAAPPLCTECGEVVDGEGVPSGFPGTWRHKGPCPRQPGSD